MSQLIGWLFKSKGVKVGTGLLSGGGIVALVMGLHSDVKAKIERQDDRLKEYVGLVIEPIKTEISHLKKDQADIKTMVRDIHKHLLKGK